MPVLLPITLGQFLKVAALAGTGGEAKRLVLSGHVVVNGETETRRGRRLGVGDRVAVGGETVIVAVDSSSKDVSQY